MSEKKGWERLREREDREEQEREEALQSEILKNRLRGGGKHSAASELAREADLLQASGSTEKLLELLDRVEPLLEQVHVLYSQFFSGVERLPPHERRKQLDQIMNALIAMPKPTQVLKFRFGTLQTRYRTHCEQWEKKLKEIESGKVSRPLNRG